MYFLPNPAAQSERRHLTRMDRLKGGDEDLQTLHRVIHVIGEIDILIDRREKTNAARARKGRRGPDSRTARDTFPSACMVE
jgi:hypothetical protein